MIAKTMPLKCIIILFCFYIEISEFQSLVGGFIEMVDTLAKQVEKEKMKVKSAFHFTPHITLSHTQ